MLFSKRSGAKALLSKREAFEKQAELAYPSVFSTALRLTRSREEAEDLAQESIVRAYEAFDGFDGSNFKAWILRITTNSYINRYRQKQRHPQMTTLDEDWSIEPADDEKQTPDRILFDDLLGAEVEDALSTIPEEFRMTVIFSDLEGMSYQEIADVTGAPVGTVRSRLARGRSLLRKKLADYAKSEGYVKQGVTE